MFHIYFYFYLLFFFFSKQFFLFPDRRNKTAGYSGAFFPSSDEHFFLQNELIFFSEILATNLRTYNSFKTSVVMTSNT